MELRLRFLVLFGEFFAVSVANDRTCEEHDLRALMVHFRHLRTEVANLQKSQQEDTAKLKTQLQVKSQEIELLKQTNNDTETKLGTTLHELADVKGKLEILETYIGMSQGRTSLAVGFVAHPSQTHYNCSTSITRLPFDIVTLNTGSAFNTSGYFEAPFRGMYTFSAKVCMHPNSTVRFSIFSKNTGTAFVTTGSLTTAGDHDCSSMSAVIELKEQELIYVGAECKEGQVEGNYGFFSTTFSGTLLHLIG